MNATKVYRKFGEVLPRLIGVLDGGGDEAWLIGEAGADEEVMSFGIETDMK
jgi:hypothetical protein